MTERSGRRKRPTKIKTIRVYEDVLRSLEMEAENEGVTPNGLITSILTKHVEWDNLAHKLGIKSVSKGLLLAAWEGSSDEALAQAARKRLPAAWRDMAMFWFHDASAETMIRLFSLFSRYGHETEMDLQKEGNTIRISFSHQLGHKFSVLLANGIDELLRTQYHIQPTVESGDESVLVIFSLP